jgi:antitoxin CptB
MSANILNESRAWPAHTGGIVNKGLERVRWRSRRGLLELDIVLGRFIDKHYAQLDEAGKQAFEALLDMPDNPLWDMIAGRQEATHGEQQALLEKIRAV